MKIRISSGKLSGSVRVPGSKSYSQRYILLAGMGHTPVSIHGLSFSEDEQVALGIVQNSGSRLTYNGDTVNVDPGFSCPAKVNVGESATSYRLAVGMLAARKCRTEFTGKPQLAGRPMEDLTGSLEAVGAKFEQKPDGFMTLDASGIQPGNLEIDQSRSSQYVSSLLLFLAFSGAASNTLTVKGTKSSEGYIRVTEECLETMGFRTERRGDIYSVQKLHEADIKEIFVEGDYSSAAFFLVLGALSSEDGIQVEGLRRKSLQADSAVLDVLLESSNGLTLDTKDDLTTATSRKSQFRHLLMDADKTPDLAPPLAVVGIFSTEGVTIRNSSRLSIKETDRQAEIIRLAESFGAVTKKGNNQVTIRRGEEILNPGSLSFDDHRMVMSAIVAGIASGFDIEYGNIERINKSYPSFLRDLKKVGATADMPPIA